MRLFLSCVAALVLTACTTASVSVDMKGAQKPSSIHFTKPSNIAVLQSAPSDHPYISLGKIHVSIQDKTMLFSSDPTQEDVNDEMKKKAAELGANALINMDYWKENQCAFGYRNLAGSGEAIFIEKSSSNAPFVQ